MKRIFHDLISLLFAGAFLFALTPLRVVDAQYHDHPPAPPPKPPAVIHPQTRSPALPVRPVVPPPTGSSENGSDGVAAAPGYDDLTEILLALFCAIVGVRYIRRAAAEKR